MRAASSPNSRMNYITLILIVAMVFGLSDFLTERVPALQRLMYVVGFATVYVLFTIKYYYGADIVNYYYHYESIRSLADVWYHPDRYSFETGYTLFVALLKGWGVSLYWMTVIISTLYFAAIALLFRQIKSKKCFALMILVVLDYNLIFAAFRQCLSVSFFIFMILCLQDRKYWLALPMAILAMAMHKSGVFVVPLCLLAYCLHGRPVQAWVFQLLMVVLVIAALLPLTNIATTVLSFLPIDYLSSIKHHLRVGKQIQSVWMVYAMLVVCVEYYLHYHKTRLDGVAIMAVLGIAIVVVAYQYYYILNRVRSFFVPFMIVWVFQVVQGRDTDKPIPYFKLVSQLACVLFFAYSVHMTRTFTKQSKTLRAPIYNACTVLDIREGEVKALQQKQLKQAEDFWRYDFMKHEKNIIQ